MTADEVVVVYQSRSGKTSILFHYACAAASEGKQVLFICQAAKVAEVPPVLPPNVSGTDAALTRIDMKCVRLICKLYAQQAASGYQIHSQQVPGEC